MCRDITMSPDQWFLTLRRQYAPAKLNRKSRQKSRSQWTLPRNILCRETVSKQSAGKLPVTVACLFHQIILRFMNYSCFESSWKTWRQIYHWVCVWGVGWIYFVWAVTSLNHVYFVYIVWLNKLIPSQKRLLHRGRCLIFFMGQNSGVVECDTCWVSGSRRFEDT